jgi:methyl coenzyme M reductase subunit D
MRGMKSIAFLVFFMIAGSTFSQTTAHDTSEKICKEIAKEQFPDDYNLQKVVYGQQLSAYRFMEKATNEKAKDIAQEQFPQDFNLQRVVYGQQKSAIEFMLKTSDPEVKRIAESQFPRDYNLQRIVYLQQVNAKKEMGAK